MSNVKGPLIPNSLVEDLLIWEMDINPLCLVRGSIVHEGGIYFPAGTSPPFAPQASPYPYPLPY